MSTRELDGLVRRSTFIFSGTVAQLRAATMPIVAVDEQTAVVRVDEVFHAPKGVALAPDRPVTLRLRDADTAEGTQAVFFAEAWLYGETVAMTESGRTPPEDGDETRAQVEAALRREEERKLLERLAAASLVVSGTVVAMEQAERRPPSRPSEHDPMWFVAELKVQTVEKGRHAQSRPLRVAFASSRDIQWNWRPKLHAGQEGIFILHRERLPGLPRGLAAVLEERDFQPWQALDHVRDLIKRTG